MEKAPTVKAYMTPFPYSVELDAPIARARELMAEHGIRHLPVKDGGALVGVISDRDIKLALGPYYDLGRSADPRVRHASIAEVYSVELTTPLEEVLSEMARRRIGSALVTKEGRLAGIFTAVDACRAFAEMLRSTFPSAGHGDDAA